MTGQGSVTININQGAFTDAIGNPSVAASQYSWTYDTVAPTISSVTPNWGSYLNAAEDNADGTIAIATSGAEDGQTVTVTGMGVTDTCTVSSDACTVTVAGADLRALTNGNTYTISVNVDDAAGNSASTNSGTTFVYDITAPSISDVVPSWGTYLNAVEDNSDGTIAITTSGAEDGQTVTVTGMGVTDTCSLSVLTHVL